jgi:hypothetical protein
MWPAVVLLASVYSSNISWPRRIPLAPRRPFSKSSTVVFLGLKVFVSWDDAAETDDGGRRVGRPQR